MNFKDITRIIGICLYVIFAIYFVIEWKKKSPHEYQNKQLLRIELWTLLIFMMSLMNKITVLISLVSM